MMCLPPMVPVFVNFYCLLFHGRSDLFSSGTWMGCHSVGTILNPILPFLPVKGTLRAMLPVVGQ